MIQSLCNFVQAVQQEAYADVYAALVNEEEYNAKWKHQDMNVIIGNDSLLRVKGRFPDNSNLEAPLLLPHDHHLTKLIVRDIHHTHMHAGPEWTLSFFMRKFWCPKARRTIKSILRQCTLCTRFKGKTIEQVMAPLPRFRVEPETRPFSLISVDYQRIPSLRESVCNVYWKILRPTGITLRFLRLGKTTMPCEMSVGGT